MARTAGLNSMSVEELLKLRDDVGKVLSQRAVPITLSRSRSRYDARQMCVSHDNMCVGYAGHMISSGMDVFNTSLLAMDVARQTFESAAATLARGDASADDLAQRILDFQMPAIPQVS